MDRKIALAIGLMLMVAVLPSLFFPPERPPAPVEGVQSVVDSQVPSEVPDLGGDASSAVSQIQPAAEAVPTPQSPISDDSDEQLVVVESDLYRFTFSSR